MQASYSDFAPCANRAEQLCLASSSRLIESLQYLIDLCSEQLQFNKTEIDNALDSVRIGISSSDGKLKLPSEVFALHDSLLHFTTEDNEKSIFRCLEALEKYDDWNREFEIVSFNDLSEVLPGQIALETLRRDFLGSYKQAFDISHVSQQDMNNSYDASELALAALRETNPDLFSEIEVFLDRLLIVNSTSGGAGSCFKTLGMIFLNQLASDGNWTRYFGDLVHESAHNYLYCLSVFVDIVHDDSGLYKTPLRPEPRPLYMAFHQMFVLARSYIAMKNLYENEKYKNQLGEVSYTYTNKNILDEYDRAYLVCSQNANKLTDVGKELLQSTQESVDTNR